MYSLIEILSNRRYSCKHIDRLITHCSTDTHSVVTYIRGENCKINKKERKIHVTSWFINLLLETKFQKVTAASIILDHRSKKCLLYLLSLLLALIPVQKIDENPFHVHWVVMLWKASTSGNKEAAAWRWRGPSVWTLIRNAYLNPHSVIMVLLSVF